MDIPVDPFNIDMVFLTHAHIDHSGRLPLLYKKGFRGKVSMTEATKSLCDIMLKDSAATQEFEVDWRNRKNRCAGKSGYFPIYDMNDAKGIVKLCKGYEYNEMIRPARGIEKGYDGFEVFVDSPLAIKATSIFSERMQGYYDEEAWEMVQKGINPIGFEDMRLSVTSDDSKAINFGTKPKVIISASEMCDAGRIIHHLKHNLWRPECTILFVGYQSNGTLGKTIVNGADKVILFGEEIQVKAKILTLAGVSGHADVDGLIKWVANMSPKPKKVFVTHGEDSVCTLFAERLKRELFLDVAAPYSGTIYDLVAAEFIVEAEPVWIHKEKEASAGKARGTALFRKHTV